MFIKINDLQALKIQTVNSSSVFSDDQINKIDQMYKKYNYFENRYLG